VPLRSKVIVALNELPRREGVVFPAAEGAWVDMDHFRSREWTLALANIGASRHAPDVRDVEPGG